MHRLVLAAALLLVPLVRGEAVDGTTGTPLGGFGAGAVKFNAGTGTFAAMLRPPADAYDFAALPGAKFQLFVEREGHITTVDTLTARRVDGVPDDDAIWPLHRINAGSVADVSVALTAFSPLSPTKPEIMSLPYAFFEFTLKNAGSTPATAVVALQVDPGTATAELAPGKGFRSKPWSVFAESKAPGAQISAGAGVDILAQSLFAAAPAQGPTATAARLRLAPGEEARVRFVLAWHEDSDPERSYYLGKYSESGAIAGQGLADFDELQANAERLVAGMRGSSLPPWLVNQTLNTLANYATNSMYKRDGRVAFAEGQWTCFGTMDQMWHARQIISQLTPWFAWQELRYWARTQMKNGQIHHDFNLMGVGDEKALRSALVPWDDTEHADYRNIQKWVDLNCAYIVSVYETYLATGDREEFAFHWPHLKRAAARILDQVAAHGSKEFPYTFEHSENSYDAGGNPDPFNAGFSAVAYRVMVRFAKEAGEPDIAARYQKAYDTVVPSFAARYLGDGRLPTGKHCEAHYGGQWLALNLELGEIWSADQTDSVLAQLAGYYDPANRGLGYPKGTYDEWTPYILVHYAGLLLNAGQPELWERMQKDAYERHYLDRNRVFNHPLNILPVVEKPVPVAKEIRSKKQYLSLPGLWRNYYDIVGVHRDALTKELWLKPILPPSAGHKLTHAYYVTPEGDGTLDCTESGDRFQNREIVFKPSRPLDVTTLYLADLYTEKAAVKIDGRPVAFTRTGTGHARLLKVDLNTRVGAQGLRIETAGDPAPARKTAAAVASTAASKSAAEVPQAPRVSAYENLEAESATKTGGTSITETPEGLPYVTSCNNFDYVQFSNVDFGATGAAAFVARVARVQPGTSIEVALDDVSAEPVAVCRFPEGSSTKGWTETTTRLQEVKGVHDVFLRFYGSTEDSLLDLDRIRFTERK